MRKKLLEAAERHIKAHGPKKLTVSDIAAECGMSQSNAYRFFHSKGDLLEAVGERWFAEIERELADIAASRQPPAELEAIMQRCGEDGLLGGREPGEAANLVEAMTARFRDPGQIMRFYDTDSPARVAEIAGLILAGMAHLRRNAA